MTSAETSKTKPTVTRESFDKKIARLAATPLPADQSGLQILAAELAKVSESFDAKIAAVEAQKSALVTLQATLTNKVADCYITLGEKFKKTSV
jgi:hypothetical protein